ncbi:thioredoxin domain-containing protein [Nocardia camponoti]|uniref:Membrane protein n=1 Tax=Nocardia camponoti TaxID=1616106 RepID=A0A917QGL2_9NOCA|nr:thioredoxin domain-containing protein [Nocardia camponoti]GGK48136.1 membrane protein [Nocardia camponoti]
MNQLSSATSPYLRQHADNPVDWQEWGPAALAEAEARDVPILLSVGYASCHWCHVMAHESFEDPATAEQMNANFVCVKVDREERPDLDAVYMNATVAMTGQGGWPMTCFLTPDGAPFYCGTYYPKEPRGGMPSFTQLLSAISDTWRTRRADVDQAAAQVTEALRSQSTGLPDGELPLTAELLDAAVLSIAGDEDRVNGGFGGAPKFPPSALLEGLLRQWERTGDKAIFDVVDRTAEAMARGGIYDQLRGGFARYAVDQTWLVPHFEKMLYDNALLLRTYGHLARRTERGPLESLPHRVARETVEFLLADLLTAEGAFASALDADTVVDGHSEEGATYVWTQPQLVDELGPLDGMWAADAFVVTPKGNFEHGTSVLTRHSDPVDVEQSERFERLRARLLEVRADRPQPARDDKVVTAWNGMAITALAESGAALGESTWIDAAARAARFLLDTHVVDGRLRRASLGGVVGAGAGVLEDYAWLTVGLLAVYQATGDGEWLSAAQELLDTAIAHFADPDQPGSWFDTADDAETLVARPRDPIDGATPSGASVLAEALLTAAAASAPDKALAYRDLADRTLARAAVLLARVPRQAGHWLAVSEAWLRGPYQVAIATEDVDTAAELLSAARESAPGGSLILAASPDSAPLLADRPTVDGQPAAYVCRGSVCDLPVTTATELAAALAI